MSGQTTGNTSRKPSGSSTHSGAPSPLASPGNAHSQRKLASGPGGNMFGVGGAGLKGLNSNWQVWGGQPPSKRNTSVSSANSVNEISPPHMGDHWTTSRGTNGAWEDATGSPNRNDLDSLHHTRQRQATAAQAAALSTPSKPGQYSPQRFDTNLGKDAANSRYNSASGGQNYNPALNGGYDSAADNELSAGFRGMAVEEDYSHRQAQGQNAPQTRAAPPMQQNRGPYAGYMQPEYSPYYGNGNGAEYGYPYGNTADPAIYAASANGGSNGNMYPAAAMHPNAVADYSRQQAGLYYDYPRHYYPTHQTMIYPSMPSPMPTPQLSAAVPATLSDKKRELQYNIQQQMNHQSIVYSGMRSSPSPHSHGYPNGLDYSAQMPVMLAGGVYSGPPAMHGFPRGMQPGRQNVLDLGMALRSPLLDEFRANKARKWELRDIFGFIVEFSGDQHGSRFIQQKLENATSEEKQMVFDEIVPDNALQLIQDVFGNYVIQKLFEHGTQVHKSILASAMEGHILPLSMQMYGCRVVQKAVEYILPEQQAIIVRELEPHVLKCVKDANGNHVIQKLIERVSPDRLAFVTAFRGSVYELSTHPYGCRVLQRCFEHLPEDQTRPLLDELHKYTINLMQDQFGNYVIQFVLEHGHPQDKALVISKLRGQMLQMARHKFASNVCEKALVTADPATRAILIDEILAPKQEGSGVVVQMMKDQFANYVLQRALVVADGEQKELLISKIRPQLAAMRRYSSAYSKHLISIERLLEKCGSKPLSDQSQEQSVVSSPTQTTN